MEHFYFIDEDRLMIFQAFRGDILPSEALKKLKVMARDPRYNHSFAVLTDLRKSTFRASRQSFNAFYHEIMALLPASGRKSAFVVSDPMISAFALLFAKHSAETREIRVFTSHESACDWLSGELGFRVLPVYEKSVSKM